VTHSHRDPWLGHPPKHGTLLPSDMAYPCLRALSLVLLIGNALAVVYWQADSITGPEFFDAFSFKDIADPTHGRVNYVDYETARSQNLTYASANHFVLRADFKHVLSAEGPRRNSVRLQSHKQYTTGVTIFNVRHMPEGCGTWPALRTKGDDLSNQSVIDIMEGVNDQGPNQVTLHTSAGCTMPESRLQTGMSTGNNCNAGCGVRMADPRSYGPSFNNNGGGWFAMERTSSFIKVWFWSRRASDIPLGVRKGALAVDTSDWGTPTSYFPNDSCPIETKFGPHNILISLTFCGDWAGNVYGSSGCPSSCVDFVNQNPSAFTDAYFDIGWLKIYE